MSIMIFISLLVILVIICLGIYYIYENHKINKILKFMNDKKTNADEDNVNNLLEVTNKNKGDK